MANSSSAISFEFFPPKTAEGRIRLLEKTTPRLQALQPEYFSVTYGAGGSTRDNTLDIVTQLAQGGYDAAPHLSFGNDDTEAITALLDSYRELGVRRIVALRGDVPSGSGGGRMVQASELVALIRQHSGDHFRIEVAAYPEIHPQAESYDKDIEHLKRKLDAGADSAITQYFFNAESYFYFLDRCAAIGIDKPIVPGIMPITNYENLSRFSRNCGADIPRWICKRIEGYEGCKESIVKFGIEVVTQLCQSLIDNGAPGIHFYTMDQAEPVTTIYGQLDL